MAIKKKDTNIRQSISFEPEIFEKIEQQAKIEKRNFSNMVNWMALNYLREEYSKSKKK